jgi:hypothetical protein
MNGICTLEEARQEAIDRAEEAWQSYNITIHAVAYGADADTQTMQDIAAIGHGKYYYADNLNISEIYGQLAYEVLHSYPSSPAMDAGSNGAIEWSYPGVFDVRDSINFTQELRNLISDCNCTGCSYENSTGECMIDLEFFSEMRGKILLDNLNVTACSYQPVIDDEDNCTDSDGDGYYAYDEEQCAEGNDCDDGNRDIHPGANEVCNGLDDDCDGQTDEGNVCSTGGNGGDGGGGSRGTGGGVCLPAWSCDEWGECQPNGTRARTCTDLSSCRTTVNKPEEVENCTYTPPNQSICAAGARLCSNSHLMECVNETQWETIEECGERGCNSTTLECNPPSVSMEPEDGYLSTYNGLTGMLAASREALYGILVVVVVILLAILYWKRRGKRGSTAKGK